MSIVVDLRLHYFGAAIGIRPLEAQAAMSFGQRRRSKLKEEQRSDKEPADVARAHVASTCAVMSSASTGKGRCIHVRSPYAIPQTSTAGGGHADHPTLTERDHSAQGPLMACEEPPPTGR